jgi:hypothetical protein
VPFIGVRAFRVAGKLPFAGQAVQGEQPGVYWPYAQASIPDEIRLSKASTRRGTIVRAWERVKARFAQ